MSHEHEPPFTASEAIREMQSAGIIPSGPAPRRRHWISLTGIVAGVIHELAEAIQSRTKKIR